MKKQRLSISLFGVILVCLLLVFPSCASVHKKGPSTVDSGKSEVIEEDLSVTNGVQSTRKIIYKANYTLETTAFDDTVATLYTLLEKAGGYVENSSVSGSTAEHQNGEFVLRLPAKTFGGFLQSLETIGNVTYKSQTGEDITKQYLDTENRLDALKIQQERTMELLKKATSLPDILALEKELTRLRTDIENMTTTLKEYDGLVEFSTVSIRIQAVKALTDPQAENFLSTVGNTFVHSFTAAGQALKAVCYAVIWMLPYLLVGGIVLTIVLLIVKKRKNR